MLNRRFVSEFGDELVPLGQLVSILKLSVKDRVLALGDLNGFYSMVFSKYAQEVHSVLQEKVWYEYVRKLSLKFGRRNIFVYLQDPCTNPLADSPNAFFLKVRGFSNECIANIAKSMSENNEIEKGLAIAATALPFYSQADPSPQTISEAFEKSGFRLLAKVDFKYHSALYFTKQHKI